MVVVLDTRENRSNFYLSVGVLLLVGSELPEVELQITSDDDFMVERVPKTHLKLLALKDVAVGTARLTGAAGDGGVEAASSELGFEEGVDLRVLLLLIQVALGVVGELLGLIGGLDGGLALFRDGLSVVSLVPLPEGGGIDLDDAALDKSVGADKFVVGGVVSLKMRSFKLEFACVRKKGTYDTDQPRLAGDVLRSPCIVSGIETESTELGVTTTDTNAVDTLGAELGGGGLATELELSLLAVVGTLRTSLRALVP